MTYVVIKVGQNYAHPEKVHSVQCAGTYDTKVDAEQKAVELMKDNVNAWNNFRKYVEKWVDDNIKLPKNYDLATWRTFLYEQQWPFPGDRYSVNIFDYIHCAVF
jgi:hypothetical protein